ncbi:MAG: phytanoyl-CoA dioxygenase family protein [Pseudomonadota bacterium]
MAGLSEEQRTFFAENGYLQVEDVLSDADLDAIEAEYTAILDREIPRLVAEGKMAPEEPGLSFGERYTRAIGRLAQMYDLYQHLDISLPLLRAMAPDATLNAGPAVFTHVLSNPRVLDIAESVLGPEITCNPVQHTRIKPPKSRLDAGDADSNIAKTNWHQDEAVLMEEVEIDMLTVWVAITDATLENGCMIAVPGSHRNEEPLAIHCPGSGASSAEIYIPQDLIGRNVVPMPVRRGGIVLLHQRTVHGSLENGSDAIRWSFDLRYNVTGQPTGRGVFPSFVARSRAEPSSVVTDPEAYRRAWFEARDRLAAAGALDFNERWGQYSAHPLCA